MDNTLVLSDLDFGMVTWTPPDEVQELLFDGECPEEMGRALATLREEYLNLMRMFFDSLAVLASFHGDVFLMEDSEMAALLAARALRAYQVIYARASTDALSRVRGRI